MIKCEICVPLDKQREISHHFWEVVGEFYRISTFRFCFWALFDTKLKHFVFKLSCYRGPGFHWPEYGRLYNGTSVTFRIWFLGVKCTFLLHYSQNVWLVSLCDSFGVLTALAAFVLFNQSNHWLILKLCFMRVKNICMLTTIWFALKRKLFWKLESIAYYLFIFR